MVTQNGRKICMTINSTRWPSGRVSDFESRGPGFDPHKGHHVVSLSKTH